MEHLNGQDLERYHLGMIRNEAELAPFEEHLLACAQCTDRAEETAEYVDAMRQAMISGEFDLDCEPSPLENPSTTSMPINATVAELIRQTDLLRGGQRLGTRIIHKLLRHQEVDVDEVLRRLASIRADATAILERSCRLHPRD